MFVQTIHPRAYAGKIVWDCIRSILDTLSVAYLPTDRLALFGLPVAPLPKVVKSGLTCILNRFLTRWVEVGTGLSNTCRRLSPRRGEVYIDVDIGLT